MLPDLAPRQTPHGNYLCPAMPDGTVISRPVDCLAKKIPRNVRRGPDGYFNDIQDTLDAFHSEGWKLVGKDGDWYTFVRERADEY